MSPTAEMRREKLISIAYFAVIIAAFFLFMKYAFWMFAPFIFALAVGMIVQSPANKISKKLHIKKKSAVAAIILILFLVIIFGAAIGLGFSAYSKIVDFKDYLAAKLDDLPAVLRSVEAFALKIAAYIPGDAYDSTKQIFAKMIASAESGEEISSVLKISGLSLSSISDKLSDSSLSISGIASPVISTAKQVPSVVVAILMAIIASFFITVGYDGLAAAAKKAMKKTTVAKLSTVKRITFSSLGKMAKSYIIIICVTFSELSVGLFILKLCGFYSSSYLLLVALSTAILDILPVLGTGTVIWPWAIYSLIVHNYGMAIGLAIIYVVIFLVRQVLEPKLVGANLGIPPILTLMGMYIGLQTIGFIGMFILPITIVVIKMLNEDGVIHVFGEKHELATEQTLPEQEIIKPAFRHISHVVHHHIPNELVHSSKHDSKPAENGENDASVVENAEDKDS